MLLLNWLSEPGLLPEGHGSSLRTVANSFKDDIASLKLLNFAILFRTHLDIPI